MCNSYKTADEILGQSVGIDTYLVDAGRYYAHRPSVGIKNRKPELLAEHIALVAGYFKKLVSAHRLNGVLDGLISEFIADNGFEGNAVLGNFIKKLFVNAVVFHDFGKINENFQAHPEKMNNPFFKGKEIAQSPILRNHSSLGAFIFICKHLNEVPEELPVPLQPIGVVSTLCFSYPIFKHHARYLSNDSKDEISFSKPNEVEFLKKYLDNYGFIINKQIFGILPDTKVIFKRTAYSKYLHSFALYSLLRLNFSLLTAADYLATNEYVSQFPTNDFGVLSEQRIEELFRFVSQSDWLNQSEGKKNFNKNTYENLSVFLPQLPQEESGANLNVLRSQMAKDVICTLRTNFQNNLFYIEAPTGGGKTNLSILAVVELLRKYKGEINKVFYVFPFTTLITQTYKSVKETLGLSDDEIIELHSKAGFRGKENDEDDQYGREKKNYIDRLFVNYPFCLLSHIKFFDLLKTNEKEPNYLLHRLANSIVVIDELQSYNPEHWDKVIYFVKKYAKAYNIRFILMSATLPKLDKLNVISEQVQDFVYLITDAKKKYFCNPNFCNRVTFDFTLLTKSNITLNDIAHLLLSESEKYANKDFGNAKPLGSVYTIIEFIFKKTASEFYDIIQNSATFFDEIFLLSGTILEHRRREIINYLKNSSNRKKKILLITTQVVEAGVDIDMDLGFKDTSLVDSDEQLAGRINRNVNKQDCKLFLFNYNNEKLIYGKDKRLEISRKIPHEEYRRILREKDFDALYDLVLSDKNTWNFTEMADGFNQYVLKIENLLFRSVNEDFRLIEQANISCFVPLAVPIAVNGTSDGSVEKIFSDDDLLFLAQNNVYPNEKEQIEGSDVFDLYLSFIHNKTDFTSQKIREKKLQGIM
ncbi:MAG: CRISPR-associated helicase Cas3', partial [Bacteroidia bacterium]|nr:CRISPR-associated helicase Cas3' [Bacteroidia bacterium]